MANALFDHGREGFLAGDIDWDGDNIKLVLIDEADDVPDLAVDEDLADRAGAARVATSANFAGKTVAGRGGAYVRTLRRAATRADSEGNLYQDYDRVAYIALMTMLQNCYSPKPRYTYENMIWSYCFHTRRVATGVI